MKHILFALLIILICSCFCEETKAQRSSFYFARGQYSLPVNENISKTYSHAFGGEVGGGLGFDDTFFQLTLGYNKFKQKESVTSGPLTIIPVRVGVRQYILPNTVYLHGNGGIAWIRNQTIPTETSFTVSAGVGAQISVIEIEAAYEGVNNKKPIGWGSWFGLKVGAVLFKH
jgi:hypothetical protein